MTWHINSCELAPPTGISYLWLGGVHLGSRIYYKRKIESLLVVYPHLWRHHPVLGSLKSTFGFYKTSLLGNSVALSHHIFGLNISTVILVLEAFLSVPQYWESNQLRKAKVNRTLCYRYELILSRSAINIVQFQFKKTTISSYYPQAFRVTNSRHPNASYETYRWPESTANLTTTVFLVKL